MEKLNFLGKSGGGLILAVGINTILEINLRLSQK
jgi:hypothetical protein